MSDSGDRQKLILPENIDALWLSFTEAAIKAQASLSLEDGIAAGGAWRAWLEVFAPLPIAQAVAMPRALPGYIR